MENFNKPEGQTTSDNFLKSEIEKDFFRAQSGWGAVSDDDFSYIDKKGFKTPQDLLKSYRELERAYSSKVSIPKDGDKEGFSKLYMKLGMPQDKDSFEIDFLDEDKEIGEQFKVICLENNILPQSAQAMYKWFVDFRTDMEKKSAQKWAENSSKELCEMKQEWGKDANRNMELVRRGIRVFSDDTDVIENMEKALGTKQMMKAFMNVGQALSEDNPVTFRGERNVSKNEWSSLEYFKEMFNDF